MVTGQVGIGTPSSGQVDVTLVHDPSHVLEIECDSRHDSCVRASRVTAAFGKLSGTTESLRFIDPGVNAESNFTKLDVIGAYRANSEQDTFRGISALHIGSVNGVSGTSKMTFKQGSYSKSMEFNPQSMSGVIASFPGPGTVTVTVGDSDLCHDGDKTEFSVPEGEYFIRSADVCASSRVALIVGLSVGGGCLLIAVVAVICFIRLTQWKQAQRAKAAGMVDDLSAGYDQTAV
jgi:hypothetical protein